MDLGNIPSYLTLIVVIAGVIVYAKKGGNKASSEANIALLQVADANKLQIEQLQKRVEVCEGLHRENLGEIGRLKGVNEEKDKRISILENVRATLDPETAKILAYIGTVAKNSESFMANSQAREDKILAALERVGNFMESLTQRMEEKTA